MKTTKTYHENATFLTDENIVERFNALITTGANIDDVVENLNNDSKKQAALMMIDKPIKWDKLLYGVYYQIINPDDTESVDFKKLMMFDCFVLKLNKKSYKQLIPTKILNRLKVFAVNVANNKRLALDDSTLKALKVNARINELEKCFYCDTAHSINSLEEQFQVIASLMLGENAPKMRKTYVRHLIEQFTIAYTDGYKNGNEIKFLQLVVNHLYDCATGKQYENKSGLDLHRVPKENKK